MKSDILPHVHSPPACCSLTRTDEHVQLRSAGVIAVIPTLNFPKSPRTSTDTFLITTLSFMLTYAFIKASLISKYTQNYCHLQALSCKLAYKSGPRPT